MFGLKWLARRQHRRVSAMKIQLKKDFDHTMTAREEGFKQNVDRLQKQHQEDIEKLVKEHEKKVAELEKKIQERIKENQELQQEHKDKQDEIVRRFEQQDLKRVQDLLILKDELEEDKDKVRAVRFHWEEMGESLKKHGHDLVNQIESDSIILEEIFKRATILSDRSTNKGRTLDGIKRHITKALKTAPLLENKEIPVPQSEYKIHPDEK